MKRFKKFKNTILAVTVLFFIQTAFCLEPMTKNEMKEETGRSGIITNVIGFSEAFASTGGDTSDRVNAVPFSLVYAKKFIDLEDNIMSYKDVFEMLETRPLEDGWTYFEAEFNTDAPMPDPGQQLTYSDVHSDPGGTASSVFGLGGFDVETDPNHIKVSGKMKIEFRP